MKTNLSLRLRITIITSILLIILSIAFTLSGLYNLNRNVIDPLQVILEIDMYNINYPVEGIPFNEVRTNLNRIRVQDRVEPFSRFSIYFMLGIISLGTATMYFLSGIALRPAKRLATIMNKVDRNNLSHRIQDFNAGDELDSIANSFNLMLDRLEEAFAREERFSAAAAHELKTPITVMKTNLDVYSLYGTYEEEEVDEIIEVMKEQTERMMELVDNLNKLSSNKAYEKTDLIKLDVLLRELVDDLSGDIREKKLDINLNLSTLEIQGNYTMLKNALANIVSNAIKYNKYGGSIAINLSANGKDKYLVVEDSGIGIREDEIERIFEPFYRVDKSRSRKIAGSGLGLSIAKEIIEDHGGQLYCESQPAKGSIFIIKL